MKIALIFLLTAFCLAHAVPPVLSLSQAALQKKDPSIKPDHYDTARTDLNADGKEDVLALMNAKSSYRGTGGTTLFIFKGIGDGLESLGSIKVVNEPIYVRKSVSHGFRDLLVTILGGGAAPGLAALQFDGENYPVTAGATRVTHQAGDELLFAEPTLAFDQKQTHQGITFQVSSPNTRSDNSVTITPSGLEEDNRPITWPVKGFITHIEAADINADGSPEIYIYGSDGGGQIMLGYSANRKKSLSDIAIPELTSEQAEGYRKKDEFAVMEGVIERRFPIYPDDDPVSKPTGKIRQLQYKLYPGEATWMLKVNKVVEF